MDVIIPTNGKRLNQLQECIDSLKRQTLPVNIVIVLGTDFGWIEKKVEEICKKYGCTLLYEPYKKIRGSHRAVACDCGLENATDEIVAFVDDDVLVPPMWAVASLKYFKDSHVAGVTSGCKPYPSPFHRVQTIGSEAHSKCFAETTEVESIPGYNSIYRREAIKHVGGFSENIGGCEDWELNYRLRNAGWKLLGVDETPVNHRHNYTWRSFIKQMFGYGWSRSRLFREKHIFTPIHSLPAIGLLTLPFLLLNLKIFEFVLGTYISVLIFLSLYVGASNLKTFIQTILTFMTMHLSWAFGYLKGLIK